jgi:CheY-like chemotaxis protein
MKILVVDDDADLLALVGFALTQSGYAVVKAPDVRTALQLFAAESPDLAILDINLPDGSGFFFNRLAEMFIAEATRMMVQVVEELEREDFRRIAAPIYGRGFIKLYAKAPLAIGITAVSWTSLLLWRSQLSLVLCCLAGLVLGAVLTAFCVQHDANHGAYFRQRR